MMRGCFSILKGVLMRKLAIITIALVIVFPFLHSFNINGPKPKGLVETYGYTSEIFSRNNQLQDNNIPDSILVLMVEFEDVKFDSIADYPDFLVHDKIFFERHMFHLSSYYSDVSHSKYNLIEGSDTLYVVWNTVFTAPNTMGYYGEDEDGGDMIERKVQLVVDVVELADDEINFNNYDTFILFHAGAGQEANDESELIQSTFLSRKSFQAGLDPENDEFPGLETDDGKIIKEISIFPESENQQDVSEGDPIYGLLGIIAQGFGHQLGLPTLWDNVSSNGISYGIGSFGLMGYGVWNANGYVPPLPCAWSRCYMGWEDDNSVEINSTEENLPLVFPMANDEATPNVYKAVISEKEYFLLENRQQNPDNSYFVNTSGDTLVTFTFQLCDNQEYYPPGNPYAGQPKFNFMDNTYAGCEWDFYLPGYGHGDAPENDGSGILIWHIDENIIEANFDPGFESNTVNGDASHKGVDLEEADGIQHMDSTIDIYSLGSPNDSYRESNNTYFGKMYPSPDTLSLPTSESYYGGIPLEILDISESDSLMTFSVHFEWFLDTDYNGENNFNASFVDFDNDGENEIFYPMPDGSLYLWDNYELVETYPISADPLSYYYSYDENTGTFLIPTTNPLSSLARLFLLNYEYFDYPYFLDKNWAAPPVVNPDPENIYRLFLPFNNNNNSAEIILWDESYNEMETIIFPDQDICTNLMLKNNFLYSITIADEQNFKLNLTDLNILSSESIAINDFNENTEILSSMLADIDSDELDEIIITTTDTLLYVLDSNAQTLPGFPVKLPLTSISLPSIADVDGNGYLDILIGGRNSFVIVNKNGDISGPDKEVAAPDSLFSAAGVIALNVDDDEDLEIVGNMSRNRLTIWENLNYNTFEMKMNYPVSFKEISLNYPILSYDPEDKIHLFVAGNNGTIFKKEIDTFDNQTFWKYEYANLQRTASYLDSLPENKFETSKTFIKEHTYFYPNPLNSIFSSSIHKGNVLEKTVTLKIMTGIDTNVKVKVFDIAGNIIYKETVFCEAYIEKGVFIDAGKLSSGIYFGNLKARNKVLKLKFAVEK